MYSILPSNAPVTLTSPAWLIGTNNGTGQLKTPIAGKDGTTREVSTFSQLQLENGRSRIYLGVHFANDDYQGQSLGLSVADTIISEQKDPAVAGLKVYQGDAKIATAKNMRALLVADSEASGFYGLDGSE